MKQLFYIGYSFVILLFFCCCDDNKKIILYSHPKKELKVKAPQSITDISIMFIIDTSSSMDHIHKNLSDNIQLFLEPIFKKYDRYNYNLAFTTFNPISTYATATTPLYFTKDTECDNIDLQSHIIQDQKVGNYFRVKEPSKGILCVVRETIRSIQKERSGDKESYFQSLTYVVKSAEDQFKEHFFGKNTLSVLFFISDIWAGIDYKRALIGNEEDYQRVADEQAMLHLQAMQVVKKDLSTLKSYAVVVDADGEDECGSEREGDKDTNYPFHLYKFLEDTQGIKFSICDKNWGNDLTKVADNFLESFKLQRINLKDIPKLDSIEIFFNDQKIPENIETGWFFNSQNFSIEFGSDFDIISYRNKYSKSDMTDYFIVRYNPLNLGILQQTKK